MIPKQLQKWRRINGISQAGLAKLLGVDVMTVSRWERGIVNIPPYLSLALQALECQGGESLKRAKRKKERRS